MKAPAKFQQSRGFAGTGHAPEQVETIRRVQQPMNDRGLFLPALFARKCFEFRRDGSKQITLAFYCFNRVKFTVDYLLRRIPRILLQASEVAQLRYVRNGLFQNLQLNMAEVPVQDLTENLVELQNAFAFV